MPTLQQSPEGIDKIAIERAAAGDQVILTQLTPAEQNEVVRRVTARGRSAREIAKLRGTSTRTISRRRRSASRAA